MARMHTEMLKLYNLLPLFSKLYVLTKPTFFLHISPSLQVEASDGLPLVLNTLHDIVDGQIRRCEIGQRQTLLLRVLHSTGESETYL